MLKFYTNITRHNLLNNRVGTLNPVTTSMLLRRQNLCKCIPKCDHGFNDKD